MSPRTEDALEAGYWEMDARIKGYGRWKETPQTERDAFKSVVRKLLSDALREYNIIDE